MIATRPASRNEATKTRRSLARSLAEQASVIATPQRQRGHPDRDGQERDKGIGDAGAADGDRAAEAEADGESERYGKRDGREVGDEQRADMASSPAGVRLDAVGRGRAVAGRGGERCAGHLNPPLESGGMVTPVAPGRTCW